MTVEEELIELNGTADIINENTSATETSTATIDGNIGKLTEIFSRLEGVNHTLVPVTCNYLEGAQLENTVYGRGNKWTTIIRIDDVPQGAKIYYWLAATAGVRGWIDVRLGLSGHEWHRVDSRYVPNETPEAIADISGSIIKTTGGTGPVELQVRGGHDAEWEVYANSHTTAWMCCTDASHPYIFTDIDETHNIPGSKGIRSIRGYYAPGSIHHSNKARILGHVYAQNESSQRYVTHVNQHYVLTSVDDLTVKFDHGPPLEATDISRPVLFLAYDGTAKI